MVLRRRGKRRKRAARCCWFLGFLDLADFSKISLIARPTQIMRGALLIALLGASAAAAFPTDDAPCEAKCIVAGHCCQGSTSACQKPSCAQGKPMDERCAVRRQTRRQYAQPTLFGHLQRRRLNDSHGRHSCFQTHHLPCHSARRLQPFVEPRLESLPS